MVQLHGDIRINGKLYPKGARVSPWLIYPFFLVHMLAFGLSGFFMAYSRDGPDLVFIYLHGGFAVLVYTVFYLVIFGVDQVRWMFINAALGLFGIYAQIDLILSWFDRKAGDFPWYVHVVPFLYYVLYTFLLYHAVLALAGAERSPERKRRVEIGYVVGSLVFYAWLYFRWR